MDIKALKHDPAAITATLDDSRGDALITKTGCKIYIPTRYQERKLATVGNEIRVMAIFAMVVGDRYSTSIWNAMMQLTPSSTSIVTVDGDEYYEFTFDKGAQITPNLNLVLDKKQLYYIYDEFIAKGHVPWFLNDDTMGDLFFNSGTQAGQHLGPNNVPIEMIVASITRNPKNRQEYYRHVRKSMEEQYTAPPTFIAFRNVIYGATNTTAKLSGAYFADGLLSALVNPSEKTELVETLLRK